MSDEVNSTTTPPRSPASAVRGPATRVRPGSPDAADDPEAPGGRDQPDSVDSPARDVAPEDPSTAVLPAAGADESRRAGTGADVAGQTVRTASSPLSAGDTLDGRYRLQQRVAHRGPVALWRGDDLVLARPVAVRVLAHAESETSASRLIAAAVRSGRLVHAGAASTYDATTTETAAGTVAYVVSEWVDGTTLTALLEDGPLSSERSARIVLAVARVLAAAHARELTHGDLHPGDVVVTPHGGVKVLDLEVRAALTEEVADLSGSSRRDRDVRALGALLYACLTGRWPLDGDRGLPGAPTDSDGSVCTPRQVRAGVPRDLDTLAQNALALGDGFEAPLRSAPDVVEALEAVPLGALTDHSDHLSAAYAEEGVAGTTLVEGHLGTPLPHRRRRFRARRLVIPLVLLLIAGVLAWVLGVAMGRLAGPAEKLPALSPGSDRPGPALALTSVTSFDPLGDGAEEESTVSLSHDGDQGTGWTTDTYRTSNFGNLKTGVGLEIDFGRPETVATVRLAFAQAGQSVELRASDTDAPSADAFAVVARVVGAGENVELTPTEAAAHRYWLVWLTQLPQTDRGFQAELDEMVFLS